MSERKTIPKLMEFTVMTKNTQKAEIFETLAQWLKTEGDLLISTSVVETF